MHTSRLSVLKKELEQRYKSIEEFTFADSQAYEYDDVMDFFGTIAVFVEFILDTEELRDVFETLLSADTSSGRAKQHTGSNAAQLMQSVYYYVHDENENDKSGDLLADLWYLSDTQGRPGKRTARDVYLRLRSALTNRIVRKTVLSRFKAYCELYKTAWLISELNKGENKNRPERFLQNFLEEYVFQQGYYPISEAHLGRGRLDTLIHEINGASFLVEAKQAGFGSESEDVTSKKAIAKIEQAIAQAQAYKSRLADYTSESDVYIVMFTSRYFVFSDEQPVKREGLNFFVEIVNIIDKAITHWGTAKSLSLEKVEEKK